MSTVVSPPPITLVEPVVDVMHGLEIVDPYRWLENQNTPRTRTWLKAQAAYTKAYFDSIATGPLTRQRVAELLESMSQISTPWNVRGRYFFEKRQPGSEQPVIANRDGLTGNETVLVDPALRGDGHSTTVAIVSVSEDAHFLAYSVRQGGTDHSSLEIYDLHRGLVLPDRLPEGFCTGIAFSQDSSGFYYCHRPVGESLTNHRAVFWHEFGTKGSQDREIFCAGEEPNLFLGILSSREAGLLAFPVVRTGKYRQTALYVRSLLPDTAVPKILLSNLEACFVPFFVHGQLLAYTNFAANNFRIVRVDLANPDPSQWDDVVVESDSRIQQFAVAGEEIFITRINRFATAIEVFGLDGRRKSKGSLFVQGTVDLLNRTTSGEEIFYSYTSVSKPASVYCYNTTTEELAQWEKVSVPFEPFLVATEEVTYDSRDGSSVPMFLAARKDLMHAGPLPTFITGYGGFGSCVTPRFTAFATFLMEQGFLFAVPALRGGSELGESWHQAGKRANRQNSFDDFIAASEWLITQGRSLRDRIAIGGGSNAGLLVGAVITQRPDLFRAAVCLGPLLDMTRYHLFDFASAWADEYGLPEDEEDFRSLFSYSPYHHVRDGTAYPAVLLISGDADTRCNPMHTRKMAARLQAANSSDRPILLDYKPAWGHTPVQPLSTKIEALTDRLNFICHELGIHVQPRRPS